MERSEPSRKSARLARPLYANYFEVGHTAFEFVLEFGDTYATKRRTCHTRIVTSPVYALELLDVLERAVRRYESRFGPVKEPSQHSGGARIGRSHARGHALPLRGRN